MKRYLTQAEADRCENAKEPVCKCRCGGAKHGAGRVTNGNFSDLPIDDPHYRPPMTKQQARRFLNDAYLAVIKIPEPFGFGSGSWVGSPYQWRYDAYNIILDAKKSL